MSRRLAREAAMCLLYEREINKDAGDETLEEMKDVLQTEKILEKHGAYIEQVLKTAEEKRREIDARIAKYSRSWKIERLSKVDLSILRLAVAEIYYMQDIPVKVTINEAVEMAKKYSLDKSPKFINGVLGAIYEEKTNEGQAAQES